VNIGGTLGPFMAFLVRRSIGIENVFRVAAAGVLLMFFAVLLFFREPIHPGEQQVSSVAQALRNFFLVLRNGRFMLFLVIFSGFWVVFWQEFIALPLYVRGYINPTADIDLILITDAATVISLQLVVSYLTRKIPAFPAMTLGFLISSFSWLIVAFHPSLLGTVLALIVLALGEITQSPRFYEYVSRLAPPGQQGTYMGFAFLPIAIGNLVAGMIGGRMVHYFGAVRHQSQRVWWAISAIGFAATLLMWIYNRVVKPGEAPSSAR
jgi:dipeptide/tripeptide permease